jgi:hypothetical protein
MAGLGVFLALLSGCGGGDFAMHRSDSGEILESYLPADVDQVFSYSLRGSAVGVFQNMVGICADPS